MCMKPMIMVGPPQAIPRISIPLAMMFSKASKLAKLLTLTVPAVFTPCTTVASTPCGAIVPLVAPCRVGRLTEVQLLGLRTSGLGLKSLGAHVTAGLVSAGGTAPGAGAECILSESRSSQRKGSYNGQSRERHSKFREGFHREPPRHAQKYKC
jgi:hypothetical protein